MKKIDEQRLDRLMHEEFVEDLLDRAEKGDVAAAYDVLSALGYYLSSQRTDPATGQQLPVPDRIRDYLSKAFYKMQNGASASQALHLTRSGPKNVPYRIKLFASYLVHQNVIEHHPRKQVVIDATANWINSMAAKNKLSGPLSYLNTSNRERLFNKRYKLPKRITFHMLKTWYYECRPVLVRKYQAAEIKEL